VNGLVGIPGKVSLTALNVIELNVAAAVKKVHTQSKLAYLKKIGKIAPDQYQM
jgi:hypothetical protein